MKLNKLTSEQKKVWNKVRGEVLEEYNHTCPLCDKPIHGTFNVHHHLYMENEIKTFEDFIDKHNLVPLHPSCHLQLHKRLGYHAWKKVADAMSKKISQ